MAMLGCLKEKKISSWDFHIFASAQTTASGPPDKVRCGPCDAREGLGLSPQSAQQFAVRSAPVAAK